ncbi:fructosamine kinase [Seiridium cupressi]
MAPTVDSAILTALGLDPATTNIASHGGSGFASTFKISSTIDGHDKNYFVKTGSGTDSELMFKGEHTSLNAIHDAVPSFCPKSYAHGAMNDSSGKFFMATDFLELGSSAPGGSGLSLARKLAKLHTTPAPIPDGYDKPMFGFPVTTCCGETPQDNSWKESWADFYANNRLRSILRAGIKSNGSDADLANAVEKTASQVVPRLLGDDHLQGITPVVIHGDLWSGNHGRGRIAGQGGSEEVVYDPSCVYGHSEYELGIMRMFGGFGGSFWKEYESLVPKAEPKAEWDDRVALYELYHHLNHWAMFGGGYKSGAMSIMKKLISKYVPLANEWLVWLTYIDGLRDYHISNPHKSQSEGSLVTVCLSRWPGLLAEITQTFLRFSDHSMAERKAVIVGISGASSSGKTTLARLLRGIFPNTFILHEDDFYKPESELPMKDGLLDWDCAEAISIPDMTKALEHIHAGGTFPVSTMKTPSRTEHGRMLGTPQHVVSATGLTKATPQPFVDSKEDKNSVGKCPVSDAKIAEMKSKVDAWTQPGQRGHEILTKSGLKICLLDGFLLYSKEMVGIMDLLDIKLFLLVSKAKATQRREARDGYVTLGGFWADPPGYVDKIVWPNYVESHAWLFEGGDVEKPLKESSLAEKNILAQKDKGLDIDMETSFEWTVDTLIRQLEELGTK